MNASVVSVLLFSLVLSVSNGWKIGSMVGEIAPLIPTDQERQLCQDTSDERDLEMVYKVPRRTCEVNCKYANGDIDVLNSPEKTLCCDMVGVGPTGKCDGNGICKVFMMN